MVLRLTRRTLLSLAVAPVTVSARAQSGDAVTFVRDFYVKEIARHAAKEYAREADFLSVFTAETQRVWHAAQANRNKANIPLGPILHVFLGQGALPGREIKLGAVTSSGGDVVSVALTIQGNPRQLVVHAVREGGAWRFSDINYGGGESFVAYHRRRAGL